MRYGEFTYELFSIIMEVSNEKQKKKSRHSKQTHNRQYKDRLWRMIFSMLQIIIWWSTMKKESGFQNRNILSFTMVQKISQIPWS